MKPQHANYLIISGESSQNPPTFLRNPSRERRRNSLKQFLPLQKGRKGSVIEDDNNQSMIEAYNQEDYESNFYDQPSNLSFDIPHNEEMIPDPGDRVRNTKQGPLKLPKINPNPK